MRRWNGFFVFVKMFSLTLMMRIFKMGKILVSAVYLYGDRCGKMPPIKKGGIFLKPFKTIDEQIQLLKARNLVIKNEEQAKDYLLSNNYYNIINGYSKYFPQSGNCYTNATTFDEVSRLYLFDKELKQTLFKAIIGIESHLKSIFAYHFAERYRDKIYAYLNIECYAKDKTLSVISTIARLSQIINKQQKFPNTSIHHYVNNHQDVPIWVLVNYIDFGELRNMLTSSIPALQNEVAKDMHKFATQNLNLSNADIFHPEVMMSFVENINELRNVCAHNNRLLDFKCRRDSKYWAVLHDKYGIKADDEKRNVFSVVISMQCFLSKREYATLHNTILNRIKSHLIKTITTASVDDILSTLGFPQNWYNEPKIKIS